jgi:hypothetical protein
VTPDAKPRDSIVVEPPWGGFRFPPLMFVSDVRLSREAIEHFRSEVLRGLREKEPFIVESMKVYQLIDGRWESLP